jgi:hypothetical protein
MTWISVAEFRQRARPPQSRRRGKQATPQVTTPGQTADLIDRLRAGDVTLTCDPGHRVLQTDTERCRRHRRRPGPLTPPRHQEKREMRLQQGCGIPQLPPVAPIRRHLFRTFGPVSHPAGTWVRPVTVERVFDWAQWEAARRAEPSDPGPPDTAGTETGRPGHPDLT